MSIKISDRVAQLETQVSNQVTALNNIMDSLEKVIVAVNGLKQTSKSVANTAPAKAAKTPVIYRYVRCTDPESPTFASPDNLHCITLAIQIDYDADAIRVGWSVADNDNVDKEVGRALACNRFTTKPIYITGVREKLKTSDLVTIVATSLGISFYTDDDDLFYQMSRKLRTLQ